MKKSKQTKADIDNIDTQYLLAYKKEHGYFECGPIIYEYNFVRSSIMECTKQKLSLQSVSFLYWLYDHPHFLSNVLNKMNLIRHSMNEGHPYFQSSIDACNIKRNLYLSSKLLQRRPHIPHRYHLDHPVAKDRKIFH